MRRAVIALVATTVAAAMVGACGGSGLPPPQAGEATLPASSSAPSGASSSTGASAAASPGAPIPAGFAEAEGLLYAGIREDARVGCAPRREDLPPKATAGVECVLGSDLVDRVGVYGFATPSEALAAYVLRLSGYGVDLRTGDCGAGTPGDRAWTPGDGPGEGGNLPSRIGCFLDENGTANVRLICDVSPEGDPGLVRYVGILGAGADLGALTGWALSYPPGVDVPVPTPPGICFSRSSAS